MNRNLHRIRSLFMVMIMTTFIVGCSISIIPIPPCVKNPLKLGCGSTFINIAIRAAVYEVFGYEVGKAILSVDISGFKRADPIKAVKITLTVLNKADREFIIGSLAIAKALGIKDKEVIKRLVELEKIYARGVRFKVDKETSEATKEAAEIISSKINQIRAGNFKLREKEKRLLAKGMLNWKKGSVYQVYTTLGLRALPDKFTGEGRDQAIRRIVQTRELGLTRKEVVNLPTSVVKWLRNSIKIVELIHKIQDLENVVDINEREMELAGKKAKQDVDRTFKKYGVEDVPEVPDFN